MSDGAIAGISVGVSVALVLALIVLQIVAYWKIFVKAGEKGWKSLIPVYNTYLIFKFSWKPVFFWVLIVLAAVGGLFSGMGSESMQTIGMLISFAGIIVQFICYYWLAKAFGHGGGWTAGLIFLTFIFLLMLGFGKSQYIGNQSTR